MPTQQERFELATHFYVRMRRHLNRIVDAVWMSQSEEYAREILRLAGAHGHPELLELVERYEALIHPPPPKLPPPVVVERPVADHYVGALR